MTGADPEPATLNPVQFVFPEFGLKKYGNSRLFLGRERCFGYIYDEYHLRRLQSLNPKPFSISFFVNFGLKNIGTVAIFVSAGGVLFSYGDYYGRGP